MRIFWNIFGRKPWYSGTYSEEVFRNSPRLTIVVLKFETTGPLQNDEQQQNCDGVWSR